jgi:hypothetical protein
MTQRLIIAVLTVLLFGAGYVARMWTERGARVPPPPRALGVEFVRGPAATTADAKNGHKGSSRGLHDSRDRATLLAEIERLRPKIEAYRTRLDQIDAEFDRELMALLTAEQRERYLARQKRFAERRAKGEAREAAETGPLTDEQIHQLQQRPLWNVLWSVSITARMDRLHRDIKLEESQLPKVRELYQARRDKFLELVDSMPPPSITLSELARQTQKIVEPPKTQD